MIKCRMLTPALIKTSVGKKVIMAVTGLMLFGFVIGHLLGNLQIFLGPDPLNLYALKLEKLGPILWVIRSVLLTVFILHILTAIALVRENRKARPIAYTKPAQIQTTFAARTMAVSGFLLLVYVIYHLRHFTLNVTDPQFAHLVDSSGHHDVYGMVILGFQNKWVSAIYIGAMAILSMHLSHGFSSLFQSLGWNNEKSEPILKRLGHVIAILIFVGYSSIPVAVMMGWLSNTGRGAV